jgi:hypothetical protein
VRKALHHLASDVDRVPETSESTDCTCPTSRPFHEGGVELHLAIKVWVAPETDAMDAAIVFHEANCRDDRINCAPAITQQLIGVINGCK